jgi:hypothetical protein
MRRALALAYVCLPATHAPQVLAYREGPLSLEKLRRMAPLIAAAEEERLVEAVTSSARPQGAAQ